MADPSHGPASFWVQANALLRKNITFQRSIRGNVWLTAYPFILCLLLLLMQSLINKELDKPKNRCGCTCIDTNGDGTCERVCGIEYSSLDQVATCSIPRPPEWPILLQIPAPEYRAARTNLIPFTDLPDDSCRRTGSCPVTILLTGGNQSFGERLAGNLFTGTFSLNSSDVLKTSANVFLGSEAVTGFSNFLEPAFFSDLPIYYIQRQCSTNSTLSVPIPIQIGSTTVQKEVRCAQGLPLWRNSTSDGNDELFKGYRQGNPERKINEIVTAYDFLNSNENNFNVSIWYNSTYKNDSGNSPLGLVRASRSVNLAFNAYLQFLQGVGTKMLFQFVKEMPKQETKLRLDFSSLLGALFFSWVIVQLFPVILTSLVYEKQWNLRIMMKMHGLGDGPYWLISYAYFLLLSLIYMLCFVIFGSLIGLKFFTINDYGIQFVFYFIYINLQISLAFLVSTFFSNVKTATVIAQICMFGSGLLGGFLFQFFVEDTSFPKREKVEQLLLESSASHAIICDSLKKLYPGKDGNPEKFAVRGMSLALPRGECFGMLGPNGAGKTSFINMMIGLTMPTSGTALVQGLDIRTDMDRIYTSMGVCPQHDMLWERLTGREDLLFYGRLKNLSGSALMQAVEESLMSVNLFHGGVADKPTGKYSGGMKRRLSVAISLIGDPKVVYMDEPSTGLDPASRNNLWNVVKRAKRDRAIILTTHSMEEAEVLCDRLGIFVDGSLQCIGNPKELKARYGGSYVFTMTTSSNQEEEVENLVRRLSPSANQIYHISGTQKFELPKQEVRIANVFQAVKDAMTKIVIQAWGLADTTLEDVFIKVARGAQVFNVLS